MYVVCVYVCMCVRVCLLVFMLRVHAFVSGSDAAGVALEDILPEDTPTSGRQLEFAVHFQISTTELSQCSIRRSVRPRSRRMHSTPNGWVTRALSRAYGGRTGVRARFRRGAEPRRRRGRRQPARG